MARLGDDNGRPVFVQEPRTGDEVIVATHNYSDPTTWFCESVRVTDEVPTDSGDGLTWNLANTNVIDLVHGKVLAEDRYVAEVAHGYQVVVRVDDVEMTMREPYEASGGDYTVDFENGTITFESSQAGNSVEVDYSYAAGSGFCLKPSDGKVLNIEHAEAQFSEDAVFSDGIFFEVRMPAEILEVIQGYPAGTIAPAGTMIPVDVTKYKTFDNLVDEAVGAFPVIYPITGPRGATQKRYGFPFRYGTIRALQASLGVELWIYLQHNYAFGGERTTATFYCVSKDDA